MQKTCKFQECSFLQPPTPPQYGDSPLRFPFEIKASDIRSAKKIAQTAVKKGNTVQGCEHPAACVVAQGIMNSMPYGHKCMVQVGSTTTKLYTAGPLSDHVELVTRYTTPQKLGNAITHFDNTGLWKLEPGMYHLLPRQKSKNRHHLRGKAKTPQAKPMDRFRAASTRRVLRSDKKLVKVV